MDYFKQDPDTLYQAKAKAQWIAFAPIAFQAARLMHKLGILSVLAESGEEGLTTEEIREKVQLPEYGVKVLVEAALGIGLAYLKNEKFLLTKTGRFLLRDPMTRINMEFTHDVCYRGMFDLEDAIRDGKPRGLREFGPWETIYEGLSQLPAHVQESWFNFDHYYSDAAFPQALPLVMEGRPKRLADVGGNTGKFAIYATTQVPDLHITIVDLPGQTRVAEKAVSAAGLAERVSFHPLNMLSSNEPFPDGFDVFWMSQFLDCFSQEQVVSILRKAGRAMGDNASLFILESYWDRQPNATAAFCLQQLSLYFTCLANGNSQMYRSEDMLRAVQAAGLKLVRDVAAGPYHTLLECRNISS